MFNFKSNIKLDILEAKIETLGSRINALTVSSKALNERIVQAIDVFSKKKDAKELGELENELREIERMIIEIENRSDYYKDKKDCIEVLVDDEGYRYYAYLDYKNMNFGRYVDLYMPKLIAVQNKLSESDANYFIEHCEKFTKVEQYREAHAILKYRLGMTFDPNTIWDLACVALHRQDEIENNYSEYFHAEKTKAIKKATTGRVGDFFQLLGLRALFDFQSISEASLALLIENLNQQSEHYLKAIKEMASKIPDT